MAKGNLFLGTASGSVGDVTMTVSRGRQVSRVRRRVIANPQTDGQILTRAILSTVAKAYSQGIAIFDHSFQGKKQGQENQERFMSVNCNRLRNIYYEDIEAARSPLDSHAKFVGPSAGTTVANSFLVSEGKLTQSFFSFDYVAEVSQHPASMTFVVPLPLDEDETVAKYAERLGLVEGDIYTLVGFCPDDIGAFSLSTSADFYFGFIRFIVKDLSAIGSQIVFNTPLSSLFTIEMEVPFTPSIDFTILTGEEWAVIRLAEIGFFQTGAYGVIRSRDDSGARSTCYLKPSWELAPLATETFNWGIPSPVLASAWRGETLETQSPLILEGGNIGDALTNRSDS